MIQTFITYNYYRNKQSFKQKNKKIAVQTIMHFFEEMAEFELPKTFNFTIYETEEPELDKILLSNFTELFGKGARRMCAIMADGSKEWYCWEWKLPYKNLEKCIEWFDCQKKLPPKPPVIDVVYDFKWKGNIFGKLYNELEIIKIDDFYLLKKENVMHILFSKTNSIYLTLIFPFEKICDEFSAVCNKVMKILPIELNDKYFHIWKPTKKSDNYIIRKV
jgi:hypothetical protein